MNLPSGMTEARERAAAVHRRRDRQRSLIASRGDLTMKHLRYVVICAESDVVLWETADRSEALHSGESVYDRIERQFIA